jgi:predicted DNA-binding transcriptional regulator YafY
MLQSSARLLRLLALFQSRATWTGPDLTSRLEITDRTLRRDVDRLRTLGYPVHSTSGPAGGYMLGAGASLPPLMLENDEGLAIAIALHGAGSDVSGVAEAGQRALAKLDKVLPTRIRKRLDALRASIVRAPDTDGGPKIDMGIVDRLAAACSEHRTVRLRYDDRGGKTTRREVEPHRLVLVGRRWYLAAWDRGKGDWRTFRVDRIAPAVEDGGSFVPRAAPDDDVAGYVSRSVALGPATYQVRVLFLAPLAVAREKIPPRYGTLTAVGARRCRLTTGTPSLEGTIFWLGMSGLPFVVEGPPELAHQVGAIAARLARACTPLKRERAVRGDRGSAGGGSGRPAGRAAGEAGARGARGA